MNFNATGNVEINQSNLENLETGIYFLEVRQ